MKKWRICSGIFWVVTAILVIETFIMLYNHLWFGALMTFSVAVGFGIVAFAFLQLPPTNKKE